MAKKKLPDPFTAAACQRLRKLRDKRAQEKGAEADEIKHRKSLEEEIEQEGPNQTQRRLQLTSDYYDCIRAIDRSRSLQKWYADEIDKTIKDGDAPGLFEDDDVTPPADLFSEAKTANPPTGVDLVPDSSASSESSPAAGSTEPATGASPVFLDREAMKALSDTYIGDRLALTDQPVKLRELPVEVGGQLFVAEGIMHAGKKIALIEAISLVKREDYKRKVYDTPGELPKRAEHAPNRFVGLLVGRRGAEWVLGETAQFRDNRDKEKAPKAPPPAGDGTPKGGIIAVGDRIGGRVPDWENVGWTFLKLPVPFEPLVGLPRAVRIRTIDDFRDHLVAAGASIGEVDMSSPAGFLHAIQTHPGTFIEALKLGTLQPKVFMRAVNILSACYAVEGNQIIAERIEAAAKALASFKGGDRELVEWAGRGIDSINAQEPAKA